jgi:hypothetical protein
MKTPEEISRDAYLAVFGEKSAARNAGRIQKAADLIRQHGATGARFEQIACRSTHHQMDLKRQYGVWIVGSTSFSADGKGYIVVLHIEGDSE